MMRLTTLSFMIEATQPTIHVRSAEINDADELAAMQSRLAEYCGYDMSHFGITPERVSKLIEDGDGAAYYVAESRTDTSADTAGMMLCQRIAMGWRGVSGVYIEDLYVKPAFRHGRGAGKLLVAQACRLALDYAGGDTGAAYVRLDTAAEDNEPTLRFYRGLGMEADDLNFRLYGSLVSRLASPTQA